MYLSRHRPCFVAFTFLKPEQIAETIAGSVGTTAIKLVSVLWPKVSFFYHYIILCETIEIYFNIILHPTGSSDVGHEGEDSGSDARVRHREGHAALPRVGHA